MKRSCLSISSHRRTSLTKRRWNALVSGFNWREERTRDSSQSASLIKEWNRIYHKLLREMQLEEENEFDEAIHTKAELTSRICICPSSPNSAIQKYAESVGRKSCVIVICSLRKNDDIFDASFQWSFRSTEKLEMKITVRVCLNDCFITFGSDCMFNFLE